MVEGLIDITLFDTWGFKGYEIKYNLALVCNLLGSHG